MHELSIVQALIEQVGAEVEKAGQSGRVIGLDVVVGRLSGVHVDALRLAFELLTPQTLVAGAALRIEERAAELHCHACGARQPTAELVLSCPICASPQITLEGGQDLLLQSIELADAGHSANAEA